MRVFPEENCDSEVSRWAVKISLAKDPPLCEPSVGHQSGAGEICRAPPRGETKTRTQPAAAGRPNESQEVSGKNRSYRRERERERERERDSPRAHTRTNAYKDNSTRCVRVVEGGSIFLGI